MIVDDILSTLDDVTENKVIDAILKSSLSTVFVGTKFICFVLFLV